MKVDSLNSNDIDVLNNTYNNIPRICSIFKSLIKTLGEINQFAFLITVEDGIRISRVTFDVEKKNIVRVSGNYFSTFECDLNEFLTEKYKFADDANRIRSIILTKKKSKLSDVDELNWDRPLNPRQQNEIFKKEKLEEVIEEMKIKLYPIWHPVASGSRQTNWETGQSSDCLYYFGGWLLIKAPLDKLDFFLVIIDEEEILKEIESNIEIYCSYEIDANYLTGFDPDVDLIQSVNVFNDRYIERNCAVSKKIK